MGRDQIESRLKLLKEGSYVPNDLLTITLKSYGNFSNHRYFFLKSFFYYKLYILIKYKENEAFEMEDMIDDFITFFVAGQETTANTLAFCFLELARNPEIVEK
jgi:hypothetical protein